MNPLTDTAQFAILWPWVWAAVLVAVLALAGLAWWRARRRRAENRQNAVWVANSGYLADIPEVRRWLRRHRMLQAVAVTAVLVATVGAGAIAARPVDRATVVDKLGTRDIVLCLDVSGSMISYDGAMLTVFDRLVDNFRGERIALSVFNASSRTIFPLTDDYALVHEQLAAGMRALDRDPSALDAYDPRDAADILEYLQFTAGTLASDNGSSMIGDGLANCALLFDEQNTTRSRSIVFATDNQLAGDPIYTLAQAANLVASRGITLHGIFGAPAMYQNTPEDTEFRQIVLAHGGMYFEAADPSMVQQIVDDVVAQQAVELGARPRVVVTDRPRPWFWVLLVGVAVLVVAGWRVRE